MSFYDRHILPRILDRSCGAAFEEKRRRLVAAARGRVLEIGAGSGANLAHYDADRVDHLWALEPSSAMWRRAAPRLGGAPVRPEWLEAPAEAIPLDTNAADTVLVTFTLCTVPSPQHALADIGRVLKPGGRLLFYEHGAAPDPAVRRWQARLNGISRCLGGGCRLDRRPDLAIEGAGLSIDRLETGYEPGAPKIGGYTFLGSATNA